MQDTVPSKYILKFYNLPTSPNLQYSLKKRLVGVMMIDSYTAALKKESSLKIALHYSCLEKKRRYVG